MVKLRDNITQNLPFISVLNYGENEYVGIIINQDQYVTSFYDLNAIKTPEETKIFLEIGETWWWESNRQFPISIFCRDQIHPFSYSGEDKWFRAGSEVVTLEIEGTRVALFVCYDLRFGDEFWKLANETDVYLVPANWPSSRREHWMTLLRARAIENLAYVVGCNRVGEQGSLVYSGDSKIYGPNGDLLADGSDGGERILYADVTSEEVASVRARFGFLQDRR